MAVAFKSKESELLKKAIGAETGMLYRGEDAGKQPVKRSLNENEGRTLAWIERCRRKVPVRDYEFEELVEKETGFTMEKEGERRGEERLYIEHKPLLFEIKRVTETYIVKNAWGTFRVKIVKAIAFTPRSWASELLDFAAEDIEQIK